MGSSDPEIEHGKPAPDMFLISAGRFSENPDPEQDIVDSLPPGLLEGRPAGNHFFLTPHQLQQIQQQLQAAAVATASQQHQQTEQVATASGGLTLALHHTAGSGTGVLTPQLLLTSQTTPSFTAYPVTSAAQHTTSIQQVLQHHVRQSILQSTIQQVGTQQAQQQSFTETSNGIINSNSKCIPVSPASPFSSRSLTPSPQQRVLTPQPVFQQVMNTTVPVLQLYQPAARTTTVAAAITPQPKNKPPQQILPKPITNIMTQATLKPPPTQASPQTGTLVLNQMIPNTGVIVGQHTSSGVQLILKSPSPQSISTPVPKAQVVVSSNGSLTSSPNTVFVQANRTQPQQVVRFITGQSLQLQQVQTSSGPAYVAVPSIQPTLQQANSTQSATVVPSVTTVPLQTSVFNQNVIKKTNHINTSCINNQHFSNSNSNKKPKKRREEETTKLDLANLIKISGIDEEDVAITPTPTSSSSCTPCSSVSSLSSSSPLSQSSPTSCSVQTTCSTTISQSHRTQTEPVVHQMQFHQEQMFQSAGQQKTHQVASSVSNSHASTPKQNNATLMSQIQTPTTPQCGFRLSIAEDGQVIFHQPQITSQSVTASVAAAAQTQLAQLVAEHGNNILQTAVVSLTGSESIFLKTPQSFALRQPQMVLQRTTATPNVVLAPDPTTASNGVRILTDVSSINGLTGKVQFVSSNTMQDHNRMQIVTGVQNPSTMSLTEQQRVQIVTAGVPDISNMSLTTEQQNHVQILTSVPNSTAEVSLTEQQQSRMEIISNVPSNTTTVNEQKSRIQVIPNSRTVSLTEQLVSDISQQIITNVPNSSNIHEQNTRVIFQNTERNNEHVHISSSERTDVHITANGLPESISNQQTKLQMIANLPQNCSISLNEQNRFHIIPNTEFTVDEKVHDGSKVEHLHVEQSDNGQHAHTTHQMDNQRFHVISNLEGQQRFMQVNEEQNRIIVEHQRVLNTSTMSFNEQQNKMQVVSNSAGNDQQRLLQQLEEQRKIQIITNLPQPQCIVQMNEQQNKVMVKNINNFEQLQQSVQQQQQLQQPQQQQRLPIPTTQTSHQLPKLTAVAKEANNIVHKLNHMPNIESKFSSDFPDKLPDGLTSEHVRNELTNLNDDLKLNNQNALHRASVDTVKSRNTFDVRLQNVNGASQAYKTPSRNNVACSPSSVISPRCTPSPHSPFNNKSPSHHSPQSPVASTQNIINSCFNNRPNLTVVTQSSPSAMNQNSETGPTHLQGKPCAAVISHSVPPSNSILSPASQNADPVKATFMNVQTENCNERLTVPTSTTLISQVSPPLSAQSSSPPTSNQNSFLNTIALPHPHNSINKTGRGKKPKKSAVVKPMVFQPEDKDKNNDGPACLNPVSNDGSHSSVVQRVQTIQLTPQKQQSLKAVQCQIAVLSGKKTRTPTEQATLQKLFNEQQKILLSGKIIPTVPGQNTQGLTFVSTPVRLVPPPSTPPSPHPPTTPPTCNKATSPLHVQVGTQTTLDEPVPVPAPLPSPAPVTLPATSVPLDPAPPPPPPPPPPVPVLTPAKRASLINEQLEIDQRSASQPDTNTPFNSVSDACKRLLRYHCFDEPVLSEKDLEKADEIFEATAKHLLDKKAQMLNKYSYLLCKESMREIQTAELVMLCRSFVGDETQMLEQMKAELNAANNPPTTCSIATQVDVDSSLPSFEDELSSSEEFEVLMDMAPSVTDSRHWFKRELDISDCESEFRKDVKRHCPDDEEINAQVQSAIDSILNLQRSDPVTDEAVRSILPS